MDIQSQQLLEKKKIMQVAQDTFISSTMWTDRLGFIAAKTTLKKLKKFNINKKIASYGSKIKNGWADLAKKNNIKISISGQDSIPFLKFNYSNDLEIMTFFTQEMLKKGFLAGSQVAATFSYNNEIINEYLKQVDKVFGRINNYLKKGRFPLEGKVKHSTFKRLTD